MTGLIPCDNCTDGKLTNGRQCEICDGTALIECEHGDVDRDERCCLICAADLSEDFVCAAEARADAMEDR